MKPTGRGLRFAVMWHPDMRIGISDCPFLPPTPLLQLHLNIKPQKPPERDVKGEQIREKKKAETLAFKGLALLGPCSGPKTHISRPFSMK